MATSDGSIIAAIISTHMPRNDAAAMAGDCPGIRIHAIDMLQPPGMGMPPLIDEHQATVVAAVKANASAPQARRAVSGRRAARSPNAEATRLSPRSGRGGAPRPG